MFIVWTALVFFSKQLVYFFAGFFFTDFFFTGFYVPYGVYVRSHFNRYYYSGRPARQSRPNHGPYWPIGAPTRANSALTSAHARDPYWPIGVRR